MKKIYLVRVIFSDTIEGYVETREDFKKWLEIHNKFRKENGELSEKEDEFELVETFNLLLD